MEWAHKTLKTTLEGSREPLAGVGEWGEGDTKSVSYSGEGCRATLVESYPAAGSTPASEKRFELDWFGDAISFNDNDGQFVLWSNDWTTESRELPLFTGEEELEPLMALSKLREACSRFGPHDQQDDAAQSQIDLILEGTRFPIFENGAQTDRWGTRQVVGTGCETWIESHWTESDGQPAARDWSFIVWDQVAPRIDPQFADFVIIDIGARPSHFYAGGPDQATHLKAVMDELGALCRRKHDEANSGFVDVKPLPPSPPRLWPRPDPVVGIGWQTNRNDWSCQLYTELGRDRFVLINYHKAQGLYYLWIWDGDRFGGRTRPADDLMVSISTTRGKIDLPRLYSAFVHDTRLVAPLATPLGSSSTSEMNSLLSLDTIPQIFVRSPASGINVRYSLPVLTLADLKDFKACADPYWSPPQEEVSFADDEPIQE